MRKFTFLLLLIFISVGSCLGQSYLISGVVVDETTGNVLPGVTVVVAGTQQGTVTDGDGKFSLGVDSETPKNLTFSFIGFKTLNREAIPGNPIRVAMAIQANSLEEVVAIGYGTTKRKSLTGAVASIQADEIKDIPVTSVVQAIEGRLAGVHVSQNEGGPDAGMKVQIRGRGSITQSSEPLYIVDGFRVSNINDIPVNDIKTIDVLKDAASTAIYGAEGSNGVVLVTTKSGESGKVKVDFNAYVGLSKVYNLTEVLSPYEFVYYQKELDPGSSVTGTGFYGHYGLWDDIDIYKSMEGQNWQDSLFGSTGIHQNYNLSISGGDKTLKYNLNYNHDDINYIMKNSAYKRDYISAKIRKDISSRLSLDFNARIWSTTIGGPSVSNGAKLRDAVKFPPIPSLDFLSEDVLIGSGLDVTSPTNLSLLNDPIYNIVNEYKRQNRFNTTLNAGFNWKVIEGLTFSSKGSYSYVKDYADNIWLDRTGQASANGGQPVAQRSNTKGDLWSIQNTLNYSFELDNSRHKFSVLIGQELNNSQSSQMLAKSKFYPQNFSAKDVLAMWNFGTPDPTITTIGEPSRISSFFGRANYIFDDKYIIEFVAREDGKNVFSPEKRWGFFPGISAAWRLSEEDFFKEKFDWISNAKIRVSYGENGNARVGSFWRQEYGFVTAANRLYYIGEQPQSALQTSGTLKNENLTWEKAVAENIGLDLGFLDERYQLTVDLYRKTSKDLILNVPLPSNSGYANQNQNIGSVSNKGVEVTLNTQIVNKRDFQFSVDFNIAFNKSIVDKLYSVDTMVVFSNSGNFIHDGDDYRVIVGQPVGLIYGYKMDPNGFYSFDDFSWDENKKNWVLKPGIPDASFVGADRFGPGHIKLQKLRQKNKDDETISPDMDRTVIGVAQPKFTGGFTLRAAFKGFDLSAFFNYTYGNDIYNANKIDLTTFAGARRYQNVSTLMSLENRFTIIDPETGVNLFSGNDANPEKLYEINQNAKYWMSDMGRGLVTDWAIEDGSFLRLSNLTVGYTLPKRISQKVLMENCRVYFTSDNLWTLTSYTGQDPEVDTGPLMAPGLDWSAYPRARTFVFGVNVTF